MCLEMMQEAQDNIGEIISTIQTERQQEEEVAIETSHVVC